MTHEYRLLVGGTVLPGPDMPSCEAIAWAHGTVLALGSDAEVREVSRGDSHVFDLAGAWVVPLGVSGEVEWPATASLEPGGSADLAVLDADPRPADGGDDPGRGASPARVLALVRGGRVVGGSLPGTAEAHGGHGAR